MLCSENSMWRKRLQDFIFLCHNRRKVQTTEGSHSMAIHTVWVWLTFSWLCIEPCMDGAGSCAAHADQSSGEKHEVEPMRGLLCSGQGVWKPKALFLTFLFLISSPIALSRERQCLFISGRQKYLVKSFTRTHSPLPVADQHGQIGHIRPRSQSSKHPLSFINSGIN